MRLSNRLEVILFLILVSFASFQAVFAVTTTARLVVTAKTPTGTLLSGVVVHVYNSSSGAEWFWSPAITFNNGTCTCASIPVLSNQTYNVTVIAPVGYVPVQNTTQIFVPNATSSYPLSVTFTPAPPTIFRLIVKIVDASSNPLGDVGIQIRNSTGAVVLNGITNSSGYYQHSLQKGDYSLNATKQYYANLNKPFTISANGTLSAPTVLGTMGIIQQPPRGVYITASTQQMVNVAVTGVGQVNSFRWVEIQLPEVIQVYYSTYNVPQEVVHFSTVFQGQSYPDPSGNYFIRFTGRISQAGQAEFDVWSTKGTANPVVVDAPGIAPPFAGKPGHTWQIPVSTRSGDIVDVKLDQNWFASFSWAPVTIDNQTLPQVIVYDTSGAKVSSTFMTAFNVTLLEYGGSQGFGLTLYRILGAGTESTAIWYIYSDRLITATPSQGFGVKPLTISSNPAIADHEQTVIVTFTIPRGAIFDPKKDYRISPNDYDAAYGVQLEETDTINHNWQLTFKPTNNEFNTPKEYRVTILSLGSDGSRYQGQVIVSVNAQFIRSIWFPVVLFLIAFVIMFVFLVLRRRRGEPNVESTMNL